jgi:hypothetical protein
MRPRPLKGEGKNGAIGRVWLSGSHESRKERIDSGKEESRKGKTPRFPDFFLLS